MLTKSQMTDLRKAFNSYNDYVKNEEFDPKTNTLLQLEKLHKEVEKAMAVELRDLINSYISSDQPYGTSYKENFRNLIMNYAGFANRNEVWNAVSFYTADEKTSSVLLRNDTITITDRTLAPIAEYHFYNTTYAMEQFLRYVDLKDFAQQNNVALVFEDGGICLDTKSIVPFAEDNGVVSMCVSIDDPHFPVDIYSDALVNNLPMAEDEMSATYVFVKYNRENDEFKATVFYLADPDDEGHAVPALLPVVVDESNIEEFRGLLEELDGPSLANQISQANSEKQEPTTDAKAQEQVL